ncbi:hypothetical protein DYGSA30_20700 [Dyella sp. GSA-30]|nr:hypothetical protein DYGSA30_20700 [Dyella sp. GSA-30]
MHRVLCVRVVVGKPARKVVGRVQKGQHDGFEARVGHGVGGGSQGLLIGWHKRVYLPWRDFIPYAFEAE